MTPPDGQEGDGGTAPRALVVDLDELCWALSSRHPLGQSSHWLNLESGESLFVAEPDSLDEVAEDPRDEERWLRVAAIESPDAFRAMEDFVDQCGDARLARALGQALLQREAWFVFERQAMEAIARRWCEDNGITPTRVTDRQPPSS